MRETQKTLAIVAVALLLTGAAFLKIPDRTERNGAFNDQGQPFFPNLKDPFACTELQVTDYDESTATTSEFLVKFKDGKWVIPSHYDYPADAKDRLAKTASGVIDLVKDTIRSDRAEDQEEMGVIDPLDRKATSLKGRGKRVTLRDTTEKVLADFIIGKDVKKDDRDRDRTGQRYVRVPGQKRIYGVNVKVDLSTRFADWIETNLLKLDASRVRKVIFDNHKVDPERGELIKGDVITIERKDASSPWTLKGDLPEGQELSPDKLSALTSALGDLKIVGVRRKPQALSQALKASSGANFKLSSEQAIESLVRRGFYPYRGSLVSNQGDVVIETDEGAVYTLRYGEVVIASGLELTAGSEDSAKDAKSKDQKKPEGATENRYLFVTTTFDPSLIPQPKTDETKGPLTIPEYPFQRAPDDPKRIAEEKTAQEKADREKADRDRKLADGQKRVDELTDRFADWYYVTPGDSFRSIVMDRAALIRPKQAKPDTNSAVPAMPGGFPQGLPQGFQHP